MPPDFVRSVCPHDCPSACALEVERLDGRTIGNFLNTTFTETPTPRNNEGRPTALIHPEDCRGLGLDDESPVRSGNRRGSVVVHAKPFEGLQRGVVVVETIWPNGAYVEGIGVNVLVGSDPIPPNGGAACHDIAVWLKAACEGGG